MHLEIDESERQLLILALAEMALERPGWEPAAIGPVVKKLGEENARHMFEEFKKIHSYRIIPIMDEQSPSQRSYPYLLKPLAKAATEVLLNTGVEQYPAPPASLDRLRAILEKVAESYGHIPDYTPSEKGSGQPVGRMEDPVSETHSKNDLLPGPGKE
jgi:hypothetical protein